MKTRTCELCGADATTVRVRDAAVRGLAKPGSLSVYRYRVREAPVRTWTICHCCLERLCPPSVEAARLYVDANRRAYGSSRMPPLTDAQRALLA